MRRSKLTWSILPILLVQLIAPFGPMSMNDRLGFTVGGTAALADPPNSNLEIVVDTNDLIGTVGVYKQIEVNVTGTSPGDKVNWQVQDSTVPFGLDIEDTTSTRMSIFGTPKFQGECALLSLHSPIWVLKEPVTSASSGMKILS